MRALLLAVSIGAACAAPKPANAPAAPAAATAAPRPPGPPDRLTLVFSASVAGQLVPCGCSPDQRGGMPRAVALVEKLRATEPNLLFVDAGDLLFESASRPPEQMLTQRQLKARTLAQGDALLGAAARALGARDLALGAQFAVETAEGVPLLDAGVAPVPGARATVLASAGPVKVGLFAAGFEQDPAATIAARAKGLRDQGAQVVVLLLHPRGDNSFAAAQGLLPALKAAGVDLAVLGRRDDPATDTDRKDAGLPPLLAVEGHGQSLLRVDVHLGQGPLQLAPGAEDRKDEVKALEVRIERFRAQIQLYPERRAQLEAKIGELEERKRTLAAAPVEKPAAGSAWAQASFVPLTEAAGADERAQKLVSAYDRKVSEINLEEAKKQPEACPAAARGEPSYVGAARCVECHEEAVAFWTQTRHGRAYETLVKVEKQFSLDCIRCHVTGWQQPGGVCRIDRTDVGGPGVDGHGVGRRDVQCEDCHGPGSDHLQDATGGHIRKEVPKNLCMRCHEAENSPHFDDATYRPYIVGPGHGQPLAKGEKPRPKPGGPLQRP
ncbi:MAG TPA: multiheme c-type cytochrome [Myxococcales bacterium]|nr:multiheme c-type cytochrome [Myxococcales bacterium]